MSTAIALPLVYPSLGVDFSENVIVIRAAQQELPPLLAYIQLRLRCCLLLFFLQKPVNFDRTTLYCTNVETQIKSTMKSTCSLDSAGYIGKQMTCSAAFLATGKFDGAADSKPRYIGKSLING